MPISRLLQLGLRAGFVGLPLVSAASIKAPAVIAAGFGGENEVKLEEASIAGGNRIKYASGASRSRTGWKIETKEESLSMRAKFKVNMRQCNINRLEEEALAVSDLDSPRYGQHLSAREVCELTSCPDRAEGIRRVLEWVFGGHGAVLGGEGEGAFEWEEEGEWLRPKGGGDDVMAKVYCSHVVVSMSAAAAAETFPEAAFRSHRRSPGASAASVGPPLGGSQKRGGAYKAILRATGDILVPGTLAAHVEFVSGLTELWVPDVPGVGTGKLDGAGAGRFGSFGGMETGDFTEVMIQPRTLRTLYGVPDGEHGGWAGQGNNRQGVAAFDDFYLQADLCAAHNLLAPDSDWLSPPDMTDYGPSFDPEADEVESDLDTQYMTLMGPGVPVTFATYAANEWVLDWATEATEGHLTPEKGGPLVWSISYGFPEAWTCFVEEGICDDGPHGYDPTLYLNRANTEFAKLAALGVSVLVASGDDGAGQAATCPVDPKFPVDVSGGALEGVQNECPFEDKDDCKCGSFEMEYKEGKNTSRCILPLGVVVMGVEIEMPGAECEDVLAAPDCLNLLAKIENGTLPSAEPDTYEAVAAAAAAAGLGSESVHEIGMLESAGNGCQMAFSANNFSFYSDCKCQNVPKLTEGSCTLSGFDWHPKRDGPTPFAPAFPASSPWVTSVGATQVAWNLDGSCLQPDLLGPGNVESAETAVNKFTGGFDGGGGFSTIFPAPDYQAGHTEGYVKTRAAPPAGTFNSTNRGFPDIAAAGHNYVVVIGGKVQQIGGTSASAPALAGLVSLMNERLLAAGKPPLGFLNPALYKAAEDSSSAFQPILPKTYNLTGTALEDMLGSAYQVGSNKCSRYSCCEIGYGGSKSGSWDPVTGLGTINYQALTDYLKIPPSPHHPEPGGHDRHRAAYVAWIVVLVFALAAATLFLVYEHRPKLMLSAAALGRGMSNMSGGDGGRIGDDGDEYDAYEQGGDGGGWGSRRGGSGWGRRGSGSSRPHGALTEMVMESEIGVSEPSSYRLLDDNGDDGYEDGIDSRHEDQRGEGWRGRGGGEGDARRSV